MSQHIHMFSRKHFQNSSKEDRREGDMNRNEAIDLVFQYDGKCSEEYVLNFCNYVDITIDKFWNTAEKFRGDVWIKDSEGNYKNKVWEELKKER